MTSSTSVTWLVRLQLLAFINFVHSRASCWQNLHTPFTVFRNRGIMLQKYRYYASIMPDAPDIVLCSKLCRHNPADPIDATDGTSCRKVCSARDHQQT